MPDYLDYKVPSIPVGNIIPQTIPQRSVSKTERRFAVRTVGQDGTLYLKYDKHQAAPRIYANDPVIQPQTSNYGDFTFFDLPPSPPISPSALLDSASQPSTRRHVENTKWAGGSAIATDAQEDREPSINADLLLPEPSMLLSVPAADHKVGQTRHVVGRASRFFESIYSDQTGSEDNRTSAYSRLELDDVFPAPPTKTLQSNLLHENTHGVLPTTRCYSAAVDPAIYNDFVWNSEDPKCIRYGIDGLLQAATPARLIAHITDVKIPDFELLSDFFLTYRSFFSSKDLLCYLISRLRWAVFTGGSGRIIRVRTFVALRHWILNYFLDDFEPDKELRLLFCELVNDLAKDLWTRHDHGGGDLQVVRELKKCWTRTCDIIWGSGQDAARSSPIQEIVPGGKSGIYLGSKAQSKSVGFVEQEISDDNFTNLKAPRVSITDVGDVVAASIWRVRQDSMDITSCSMPILKPLGRVAPSFRPRMLMPIENIVRSLPSMSNANKQAALSDDDTIDMSSASASYNAFSVAKLLPAFDNGDLIRGLVVCPPRPQVTRNVRTSLRLSQSFDSHGLLASSTGVTHQLRRKFSDRRYGNATVKSPLLIAKSGFGRNSPLRTNVRNVTVSKTDILATIVNDAYQELVKDARETNAVDEEVSTAQMEAITSQILFQMVEPFSSTRQEPAPQPQLDVNRENENVTERQETNLKLTRIDRDVMSATRVSKHEPNIVGLGLSVPVDEEAMPKNRRPSKILTDKATLQDAAGLPKIRRKLGGDLRLAENNSDLVQQRARRRSTGSYPSERCSRVTTATMSREMPNPAFATKSSQVRNINDKIRRSSLQVISTHGPNHVQLRHSFLAEVERFNNVTQMDGEDGGVDSTLAKLEGRIPSPQTSFMPDFLPPTPPDTDTPSNDNYKRGSKRRSKRRDRLQIIGHASYMETSILNLHSPVSPPGDFLLDSSPIVDLRGHETLPETWPSARHRVVGQKRSSYRTSTPQSSFLLDNEQSLSDEEEDGTPKSDCLRTSGMTEFLGSKMDVSHENRSFFIEDDSALTFLDESNAQQADASLSIPTIVTPGGIGNVPTQNGMLEQAAQRSMTRAISHHECGSVNPMTITKKGTETEQQHQTRPEPNHIPKQVKDGTTVLSTALQLAHSPFILAFSSEVLASQMTVIEKDALQEIDWKELIDMQWTLNRSKLENWAEYIRFPNQSGVDIVKSRSELVINWVIAEILLVTDINERGRTISKYIHIATHSRRMNNFATTFQLITALKSPEVSRLAKTWALVGVAERKVFDNLVTIINPDKNYINLRSHMSAALLAPRLPTTSFGFTKGKSGQKPAIQVKSGACIPYLGVFLQDLQTNALKPMLINPTTQQSSPILGPLRSKTKTSAVLASAAKMKGESLTFIPDDNESDVPSSEPMINFQRFQTAAGIVKDLLKYLEASVRYDIKANKEMVGRCLWIATLPERELLDRSRSLE